MILTNGNTTAASTIKQSSILTNLTKSQNYYIEEINSEYAVVNALIKYFIEIQKTLVKIQEVCSLLNQCVEILKDIIYEKDEWFIDSWFKLPKYMEKYDDYR